ncbi:MAG: CbrC family protein [bacterium]
MYLPKFKYHPDPLGTGSIIESEVTCECCKVSRGYIYTGPVYAEEELADCICPWCIADGSAHEVFDAEFADLDGVGDYGSWESVPQVVAEEVAFRTPGFSGWQQERWWTHCGDAAEFLGPVGSTEAEKMGIEFLKTIRNDAGMEEDPFWKDYLAALHVKNGPTAYAFRCRHCGKIGGYSDCH